MSLVTTMLDCVGNGVRFSTQRDANNGTTYNTANPTTLFANVACGVQQARASVQALYAQREAVVSATIYFAQDPGLEVNDAVDVTDRMNVSQRYLVEGEAFPAMAGTLWGVTATLIRTPGTTVAPWPGQ
jgi:hypothetical protein